MFVSYHSDTDAMHINASSISWQGRPFYAFPPFVVIRKVLRKIVSDVATGIIVVSNWSTQPWYSLLIKLLIPPSTSRKEQITPSSQQAESFSLHDIRQNPGARKLSAETNRIIQQRRRPSTTKDMTTTLRNGKCFVMKGVLIPFYHL